MAKSRRKTATQEPTLYLPLPHPGQWAILNSAARFRVVACGRRFGKTELGKVAALLVAADGGRVWWVAPTQKMALELWQSLLELLETHAQQVDRTNRILRLPGGGELRVQSAHVPDHLRGTGLDLVVVDEAAFCSEQAWQALRPALSDRQGQALFLSTPQGRNWFWRLYQRGLDPLQPDWACWQMPTQANPLIPAGELEAARRDLPARQYQEEYEAAFLDDYGSVFRNVLACVAAAPARQPPGEPVCMGIDWGRVYDYTVVAVLGMQSRRLLHLERFHQVEWRIQRQRVLHLAGQWRPRLLLAEANSIGGPNIEALQQEGLPIQPFMMTAASKPRLIDQLAAAIDNQDISLLDDPVLLHELMSYGMQRSPTGHWHYSAPEGGHDDTVIALALAYHASLEQGRGRIQDYR